MVDVNMMEFKKITVFLSWAVFTFLSHYYAKIFLSNTQHLIENVIILTGLQMACGSIIYLKLFLSGEIPELNSRVLFLGICHLTGVLMTNSSLAVTSASLTHMIKMSEPLFTSFILAFMGKMSLNSDVVFIMMTVLVSAIGSEPLSNAQTSLIGLCYSVGSNLCFALRNIGTKYFFENESSSNSKTTLDGFASISLVGFLAMAPSMLAVAIYQVDHVNFLSPALLVSSSCHAVYNLVSLTLVLSIFNPVQHALLNVGKRISIVMALFVFSQRSFSIVNIFSAMICLAVIIYGVKVVKVNSNDKMKLNKMSWVMILFSVTAVIGLSSLTKEQLGIFSPARGYSDREVWKKCIHDIQDSIIDRLSDVIKEVDPMTGNSPPLLLIDPSYTFNIGDSLIVYGELVLMERLGYSNHTECHILQSMGRSRNCGDFSHLADGGMAWWTGGGNWGDLCCREAFTIRRMRSFTQLVLKGKTVIGMPQSLHYHNQSLELSDAADWMANVTQEVGEKLAKEKIVLTWRQRNSFAQGKSIYNLLDNRLVPDMAFMIGPLEETSEWNLNKEKVDILFFLRSDGESKNLQYRHVSKLRSILDENPHTKHLTFNLVDWWDYSKYLDTSVKNPTGPMFEQKVLNEGGKFDYMKMFRGSIAMYNSSRVVITDRLHGSIFAFLLHKPHVYLEQSYGKIRLTREVAFNTSSYCQDRQRLRYEQAEDIKQAVDIAVKMLTLLQQ